MGGGKKEEGRIANGQRAKRQEGALPILTIQRRYSQKMQGRRSHRARDVTLENVSEDRPAWMGGENKLMLRTYPTNKEQGPTD